MKSGPRLSIAAKNGAPVPPVAAVQQVVPPTAASQTRYERMLTRLRDAGQTATPYVMALWARKWTAVAALAALSLALYLGPTAILGTKVIGEVAVRGLFLQTVVASGHVEAPFRVTERTRSRGKVLRRWAVPDGIGAGR
jgi:uncharacterized protein (DUF58 family)